MKREHEQMAEAPHDDVPIRPERSYLALSGTVDATPAFVQRLVSAGWARRLLYNAAIDRHVPFAEGVAYRLDAAVARREARQEPAPPARSETFMPVPRPFDLHADLTRLRERRPDLAKWPATMLRAVLDQACKARGKYVEACALAKAEGRKPPRLHFRSAADAIDVSTESFRLSRCGDGAAVTKPKRRSAKRAEARRRRRERETAEADRAWAQARRDNGMREGRVLAGLRRRAQRRERDRQAQAARERGRLVMPRPNAPVPRRDSPRATLRQARAKVTVQGLGTVRIRLSRPIPDDAEVVRIHFVKEPGPNARVGVRVVVTVPAKTPDHDELETGARIHAVIRTLPATATPLDAVEAVRAAGIPVRGDDWNVSAPSADDRGHVTPRVMISRTEVKRTRDIQQKLSHKDRLLLQAREKDAAPVAEPLAPSETPAPKARKRPPKRSRSALKLKEQLRRRQRKLANRAATQACRDAKHLAGGVVLVASDPQRMAKPILAKGGPAERRAKAAAGEQAGGGALPAQVPKSRPPRGYQLTPAQQRAMRRNMHMARPGYRVRRLSLLCGIAGVIHATPGHEGTTRTCPRCEAVEEKPLEQRRHDCLRCGLRLPRDQASALVTLGRALLEFRVGPDPGGRVARARAEMAVRMAKAEATRLRRAEGGRKASLVRRERAQARVQVAGATPAGGASAPSLQGVVPLRSGLGSGRNIGGVSVADRCRDSN